MILITGGTGYIGSHTAVELMAAGEQVLLVDDLSNSKRSVLGRITRIIGRPPAFVRLDLRDRQGVARLFEAQAMQDQAIEAVIHFAGKKAVGESVARPAWYYDHNVGASAILFEAMQAAGVFRLVFSSSATVYGNPATVPITEQAALQPSNPYGHSKAMIEQMLADLVVSDARWQVARLRYFNPVGAHASGLIGEDPHGTPNNLMPYIAQVAVDRLPALQVFGQDYPTVDGTGVRDYIHVVDLARGHLAALRYLRRQAAASASDSAPSRLLTVNLGTGRGTSVREMVAAFRQASGHPIPCVDRPRRPGDIASCYADVSLAQRLLGWSAEYDLARMCADSWRWQSMNPEGLPEDS